MSSDKTQCICGSTFLTKNTYSHNRTKHHIDFFSKQNPEKEGKKEEEKEDDDEDEKSSSNETDFSESVFSDHESIDSFLNELETDVFVSDEDKNSTEKKQKDEEFKRRKQEIQLEKQQFKLDELKKKALNKPAPKQKETKDEGGDGELFSEKGSEILGLEKRTLIKKIQTFKHLFSDIPEIKKFRIKKKATEEDLKTALNELDAIINTNSVDAFLSDAIYSSIQVAEGVSSVYAKKYDITGLSIALKSNNQFNNLLKQLFIRFNTFSAIPAEMQVVFIVATTAYLCIQKNKSRTQINAFLDEEVRILP